MTVSVIIPCYNIEDYAGECIESVMAQTYSDLDIIVIDDGSTDKTGEIIDDFAARDSRITVVHEDNKGLSFARNKGMSLAKGECLAFVDGDDAVGEDYFKTLVNNMLSTGADMAGVGRYENVLSGEGFRYFSPVDGMVTYHDYRDYIFDAYTDKEKRFFQSAIVMWGKLFRREVFDGIEFPVGRINEDSWVFPRVISRCQVITISPETLYFYRKRKGSIMSEVNEHLVCSKIDSWMSQILWWRESDDLQADRLLAMCEKYICHYIYTTVNMMGTEYRKGICPEYRKMVRHMLFSRNIRFVTKVKYLTIARPGKVFK